MPVYIYQCQGLKQMTTNKQRRQEWVVIYITLHLNVDSYNYNYKYNYKNIQILTAFYVMTPQTSSSCPKPACEAMPQLNLTQASVHGSKRPRRTD